MLFYGCVFVREARPDRRIDHTITSLLMFECFTSNGSEYTMCKCMPFDNSYVVFISELLNLFSLVKVLSEGVQL